HARHSAEPRTGRTASRCALCYRQKSPGTGGRWARRPVRASAVEDLPVPPYDGRLDAEATLIL
ncbi:MAG: hypothetical protein ACRD1T_04915, partial [Acidimicrobiia bacterium]